MSVGATRTSERSYYLQRIEHYLYAGDTALHVAAAAYDPGLARELVALGADPRARNRLGAEPLHYAAAGQPGSARWNPEMQAQAIECLIAAGADPNATNKNGTAPIHVAVRTRCAAAVRALVANGANADLRNRNGSTALSLAMRTTGRGGSGSPAAKAEQAEIIKLLEHRGAAALVERITSTCRERVGSG